MQIKKNLKCFTMAFLTHIFYRAIKRAQFYVNSHIRLLNMNNNDK